MVVDAASRPKLLPESKVLSKGFAHRFKPRLHETVNGVAHFEFRLKVQISAAAA
jgi:hypothetical protein